MHEGKKYYSFEADSSPTINALKKDMQVKIAERVRHAKSFSQALDEAAPAGTIMEKQKGHSAWVKLPEKVLATLWAKAKHEGVLGSSMGLQAPQKEKNGYKSAKHSPYYTQQGEGRSVHSALLKMATDAGYDDLVHAMVESGLRHHPDGKHDEALQAISQGYNPSKNRIIAMQKLADKAGLLDRERGSLYSYGGSKYGILSGNYTSDHSTVRQHLDDLLAQAETKKDKSTWPL